MQSELNWKQQLVLNEIKAPLGTTLFEVVFWRVFLCLILSKIKFLKKSRGLPVLTENICAVKAGKCVLFRVGPCTVLWSGALAVL